MSRIAIVTATRAEYGILTPLIKAVSEDDELDLDLIVTGTHLSEKHGKTVDFIKKDGFTIAHQIPILVDGNDAEAISITMSNALINFAACFKKDRPKMVVILGDRTEMLSVAVAAMNECIPIVHIHGGEVTEGAVDDCIRHALTKMSYLHFASTEVYKNRIIQLGEHPERVYNVGALSTENILKVTLMSEREVRENVGIPESGKYAVVTFHPVTLEDATATEETLSLCKAMDRYQDIFFLITMANADVGGDLVNEILKGYVKDNEHAILVPNLGMKRYLSAVKYANFVLGNSSSGLIEAPVLGTPTVNIGDRQNGRLMADSVINCTSNESDICQAIDSALRMTHTPSYMYGNGDTSRRMIAIMKKYISEDRVNLKKGFFDIGSIENDRKVIN